ncbi:MAG: tetratricopeptide repeat protein [Desulfobacterales bacterium]|nr:tetratricopeptide repeat protein [Desulfobacterales bacterium]
MGTYLESRTEVKDFNLTKDQIITLTAGIVRTEIVKETWDGKTFWLKAKIEADPDEVIRSVDSLRKDHQKTKELEETRRKAAEYLKEMERLNRELVLAKGDTKKQEQYNEAVNRLSATDWLNKGYAYYEAKEYQDAIYAFNRVLELDPKDAKAYYNRGISYKKLGNLQQAFSDYKVAARLGLKEAQDFLRGKGMDWY